MFVNLAYGTEFNQSISTSLGITWIACAYILPIIPLVGIFREYSKIQKPPPNRVVAGIVIFIGITIGLAFSSMHVLGV